MVPFTAGEPLSRGVTTSEFFVGRARELGELQGLLDRVRLGQRTTVMMSGALGIGKSRLARVLHDSARQSGLRCLWVHCGDDPGAPPFWPWMQVLRELMRQAPAQAQQGPSHELYECAAALLSAFTEHARATDAERSREDFARARFALFDGISTLFRQAAGESPLVLVLDDAHHADVPSLKLLEFLVRTLRPVPVLIVLTCRDTERDAKHPLNDTLGEIGRQANLARVGLTGIDVDACADLMLHTMGYTVDRNLIAKVHARTEGNPLFIHEMIRHLCAQPDVHQSGVSPQLLDRIAAQLPESIRQIFGARINRLGDEHLALLQLAAVVGREFSIDILATAAPQLLDVMPRLLDVAHHAGIIEHDEEPRTWRFSHGLLHEVLYERIASSDRARLHADVAQAIEQRHAANLDAYLAALSHHYLNALPLGYAPQAVAVARRCGDHCLAGLAFEEAARQYDRALLALGMQAERPVTEEARLLISLGRARLLAGDSLQALSAFHQATQRALAAGEVSLQASAAIEFEEASWRFSMLGGVAVEPLRAALAQLGEESVSIRAEVLSALGRALLYIGALDESLEVGRQAVLLARKRADPRMLVRVLFRGLAPLDLIPGQFAQRLAATEEGIRHARHTGLREYLLYLTGWHVYNLTESGDVDARAQHLAELGRLADEQCQPLYHYVWQSYQAQGAVFEGRFDDAERMIRDSLRMAERIPELDCAGAYGVQMLCLRRLQGRLAEVAPILAHFERDTVPDAQWKPGLMLVHCDLGRRDRARTLYDQLVRDELSSIRHDARWLLTLVCVAEVCLEMEDEQHAESLYLRLQPYQGRNLVVGHHMVNFGPADRYLGALAGLVGRWQDAEVHFAAALASCERQGAAPSLAETRYRWAVMLKRQGSPADHGRALDLLDAAQEGAARLAMGALLERITALRKLISRVRRRPAYSTGLSPRELEVLRLVAKGRSNEDIARTLFVSKNTVAKQVRSILIKTGSANRTEAASFAMRNALL